MNAPPGFGVVKMAGRWPVMVPEHRAGWDAWGGWELARFDSMHKNLRRGDVVFDVGAEQGDMTAVYAQFCGGEGMVLFEPNPDLWRNIRKTWEANGHPLPRACCVALVGDNSVDVVPNFDATDRDGWPACAYGDGVQEAAAFRYLHDTGHTAVTPQVALDDWTRDHTTYPDVITIDIEGAELRALRGARHLLTNMVRPLVYVSVHPDLMIKSFGDEAADLHKYMAEMGYRSRHLGTDHEEHWVFWDPKHRPLNL